jgi:2-polyprenyl-6-methoxyphenol hydroxylase-like FAD-dependent oxidoreductase
MARHAVILGAGVAGLAAAIGLARRDWSVTVVERDPGPPPGGGDRAFVTWERRSVPQFRQPHAFTARARNLLLEHAPDVVDRLRADGIEESNVFKILTPPEQWQPDDDAFTGLMTRRPAFELALRRTAEAEPGIEVLCPQVVSGLLYAPDDPALAPRVVGVQLADGRELPADVVLDCGGKRSPVARWLAEVGVDIPEDVQDCGIVYYTRYYRRNPESPLPLLALFGVIGEIESCVFLGFAGDHDTYGIMLGPRPEDDALRALKHTNAWEAVARSIPAVAPWVDAANGTPLNDVQTMAGNQNVHRYYVVDGEPLVLGMLTVGDALCTTNPFYGWGASMALTYAFGAAQVVEDHFGDPRGMALAYEAAVRREVDAVYRESAAIDRARTYRVSGAPVPDHDRAEVDRQELIARGVMRGSVRDPTLARAFLRRINLIDAPDAILDDPEVLAKAIQVRDESVNEPLPKLGPDREELLAILADLV